MVNEYFYSRMKDDEKQKNLAEILHDKMGGFEDQDNQAILDEHCQRVWSDLTPCRSPPDPRRKMLSQCKIRIFVFFLTHLEPTCIKKKFNSLLPKYVLTFFFYQFFQRFLILIRSSLLARRNIRRKRKTFTARFQRTAAISTIFRIIRNAIGSFQKVGRFRSTWTLKTLCRVC